MRRSCTASTLQRCYAIWQKSSQHSSRYLDIPFRASSFLVAFPFDCISGVPFHMLWGELRALLRVFLKKGHADSWSWRGKKTLRVLVMNMFRSTSWQVGKRGRHLMNIIWDQSHLQQSPLVDRDSPNGFWYSPIYWLVSSEVIINQQWFWIMRQCGLRRRVAPAMVERCQAFFATMVMSSWSRSIWRKSSATFRRVNRTLISDGFAELLGLMTKGILFLLFLWFIMVSPIIPIMAYWGL